jgi:hypothetical protein
MEQRQLHVWLTEGEYHLIRDIARERGESVSAFIRRIIRVYRFLCPESSSGAPASVRSEGGPELFG